jgi:hypothetical protein
VCVCVCVCVYQSEKQIGDREGSLCVVATVFKEEQMQIGELFLSLHPQFEI